MLIRTTAIALAALAALSGAASAQSRNVTSNYDAPASVNEVSRAKFDLIQSYPQVGSGAAYTSKYERAASNPLPDLTKIPQYSNDHGTPASRRWTPADR